MIPNGNILFIYYNLANRIEAEQIWVIRDDMICTSRPKPEQLVKLYMKQHFKVSFAADDAIQRRATPSVLARLYNSIHRLFATSKRFPKWIVLITEADISKFLNKPVTGAAEMYGRVLNWLMSALDQLVNEAYRDKDTPVLYTKPRFLWIEPTLHVNYPLDEVNSRRKMIKAMHIVAKAHPSMLTLPLKQGWSESDRSVTLGVRNGKLSDAGVYNFWDAVDNTVRFADIKLNRFGSGRQPIDLVFNKYSIQQDMERRLRNNISANDARINWRCIHATASTTNATATTSRAENQNEAFNANENAENITPQLPPITSPDQVIINNAGRMVCQVQPTRMRVQEEGERRGVLEVGHVHRHYNINRQQRDEARQQREGGRRQQQCRHVNYNSRKRLF